MPWTKIVARGGRRYRRLRFRGRVRAGARNAGRMRLASYRGYNAVPTFTETFLASPILFNQSAPGSSTSLLQVSLSQIPQVGDYLALYNQYCIKSVTAILVPAYNVYDQPAVGSSVTQAPRLVWAIQDSAVQAFPTSEADVLQDNGAKIRMFTKPIKITWRPKPAVADALVSGGFAGVNQRGSKWYTTGSPGVLHNGLAYSFTNEIPISGNPPIAQVYIKMTFSLRDPK